MPDSDELRIIPPNQGDKPFLRPVRKRGWHRALKAGKLWAFVSYKYRDCVLLLINGEFHKFAKIIHDRNIREDDCYITWPFPSPYFVSTVVNLELK